MTYDPDNTPDYVHKILGPMREYYTNEARGKQELLGSLVKVDSNSFSNFLPKLHDRPEKMVIMPLKETLPSSTYSLEMQQH